MKIKLRKVLVMVMVLVMLTSQVSFAATPGNPYTTATLSTTSAYAYMSIGEGNNSYLEIMYVSQQVLKTNVSVTYSPQEFARNTGWGVSGTKSPKTNYIFVNCTFSFYVDGARRAILPRTV